ncbi:MAG: MFS transporter [Vicinamibacterales bacterium]
MTPPEPASAAQAAEAASLLARIERVPFSRWHIRPRLVVGSATFFDAFDALSLAFVLPVLAPLWGLAPAQIGSLISAGYLGQFLGALLFGGLAERIGRIRAAAGAVALMSVMSLGCALAPGYSALLAFRFVQGIGVGGEMPVAATYINELSKAKGRGRFFLLYEMLFPIGLMMTGQIGAVLVPALGWQVMFLIGGIPGLVITALLVRLPESPRWLLSRGRIAEAAAIVRDMEAHAPSPDAAETVPTDASRGAMPGVVPGRTSRGAGAGALARGRWSDLLRGSYLRRTLVAWSLWSCAYFVTNGLNNWMPTIYNQIYGLNLQQSLRAGTLTNVMQVVVLLGCAFLIDRFGRRSWTVGAFAAGAVMLGLLGLSGASSITLVIALVTLSYGIVGSANAVLYLYTPEIYPTRMRAIATGAATCWLRLASALAPILVGTIVARGGIPSVFLMFAGVSVVGALAGLLMLETRNRPLEDLAA